MLVLATALVLIGAVVGTALVVGGKDSHRGYGYGPGMMGRYGSGMMGGHQGGYGPGMMYGYGGEFAPSSPVRGASVKDLNAVHDRVSTWLRGRGFDGFKVAEVMAFTRNDYVAVQDAKGKPAFELLATPNGARLMEEPPSMMWNTHYGVMRGLGRSWMGGMMGGGYGYSGGHGKVTSLDQAARVADRWLAQTRLDERADADVRSMGAFPGYFTLDTTRSGKTVGMVSVSASTGAVWYHTWHGAFLAEREF